MQAVDGTEDSLNEKACRSCYHLRHQERDQKKWDEQIRHGNVVNKHINIFPRCLSSDEDKNKSKILQQRDNDDYTIYLHLDSSCCGVLMATEKKELVELLVKRHFPLIPSEEWHKLKNQNSLYFFQIYFMVRLETWWMFFFVICF